MSILPKRRSPIFGGGSRWRFPARDTAPGPVSLADYHRSVAVTRGPSGKIGAGAAVPEPDTCCEVPTVTTAASPDERWLRNARYARWLAWASLAWMAAEGVIGLIAGFTAGSIALVGWALGSGIEGLASVIVVWRFTGSRTLSETAEQRAQKAVAVSFWLLAPYIAIEAIRDLVAHHPASGTPLGIALTASSLVIMPVLGMAKRRLGERLGSGATAGEGTQNLMCAAQAAGVLLALVVVAVWPGGWPIDPIIALGIAGWSAWEGNRAWRGADCC
jgi:divalent metal cation (Fe/Co/Zn/Cd) transporter